ncbi:MAG TPA: TetR/AcrR family transcriptional regulator [Streptosporangiaceae bacterium]|nr:TetR/AcrR family transcriptional regulator [Streptosporangiaceae bacterium]
MSTLDSRLEPGPAAGRPYHHGDLRNALVRAAMQLARRGGPEAIVLREVARQVGVSPAAAYRHFADHEELIEAVKQRAMAELGEVMQDELRSVRRSADPAELARRRLAAIGRGYLRFAWSQPPLFRAVFSGRGPAAAAPGAAGSHSEPHQLLAVTLDDLVAAGALTPARRAGFEYVAWAAVHGLALLCIDGPLRTASDHERARLARRTIDMVLTAL